MEIGRRLGRSERWAQLAVASAERREAGGPGQGPAVPVSWARDAIPVVSAEPGRGSPASQRLSRPKAYRLRDRGETHLRDQLAEAC